MRSYEGKRNRLSDQNRSESNRSNPFCIGCDNQFPGELEFLLLLLSQIQFQLIIEKLLGKVIKLSGLPKSK